MGTNVKLMLLVVDDARSTCYPIFRVVRLSKPRRAGLILSYNGSRQVSKHTGRVRLDAES